jgi:membrane-associated phospholipid phosphatase
MKTMILAIAACAVATAQIEPGAGMWKTWVIQSGSQFRLPPPDAAGASGELAWLKQFMSTRDATTLYQVRYWDSGSPLYRWQEIAFAEAIQRYNGNNVLVGRAVGLVNIAAYEATVAAWDSKYTYNRPRPKAADPTLASILPDPQSPSYPCEHSATAGAAAAVLSYLFPDKTDNWTGLAEEAARSRLFAGVEYPSDVIQGLALGRKVAAEVVARAKTDGSDAVWTGTVPTGPGLWNGVNPALPLTGTWKTWVLQSGSQLRPQAPPSYDSDQKLAELAEVRDYPRTFNSNAAAFFWQAESSLQIFSDLANKKIGEYHLDSNAPQVARVFAVLSIANFDATVACWDGKYAYWAARPFMLDAKVTTLFPTPNHPSYPAAHGCNSGSNGRVLAHFFPQDADFFTGQADQAGESRIAAGIHFRSDVVAGLALGRAVADLVITADGQ